MGMSRCYSLMKCLLILFNVIFLFVGVAVCAFAGWALWDGNAAETSSGRAGLAALAAWGALLTLGAITALAGACRSSPSLLALCFALLALCCVGEGAGAWWGAAHLPRLRQALSDRLLHSVTQEYGLLPGRTHVIDAIQSGLECCGAVSTRDWQQSAWAKAEGGARGEALDLSVAAEPTYYYVPASCCVNSSASECESSRLVPSASATRAGLHSAPCAGRVLATLENAARAPLVAAAALLATHVVALLLALALCLRAQPASNYKA